MKRVNRKKREKLNDDNHHGDDDQDIILRMNHGMRDEEGLGWTQKWNREEEK